MDLVSISRFMCRELEPLRFASPVTHVYNPLKYARVPHEQYLTRYGEAPTEVLLIGMNPGPFGMAQTGVPFGAVAFVRDWLLIDGPVDKPGKEHPKRPVEGFACQRSEVSGTRLWGWVRERFGTPEAFFERFFVGNYCPLCFLEASGRNRTPDKLSKTEKEALLAICDEGLRRVVDVLRPRLVVGVGAFAEARARSALAALDVTVGRVLHPSPASPAANRGWAQAATRDLRSLGIRI